MLKPTSFTVPVELIQQAQDSLPNIDFRLTLNQPNGRFFYDKWVIKNMYIDTVWHELLKLLPEDIGEARLIKLDPGSSYRSHSDIDDRYHLNITGDRAYLINLDTETMYKTVDRSVYYELDASPRHSAANFNRVPRVQLVVRKLLKDNIINDGINIIVTPKGPEEYYRFIFDDTISSWLNINCKNGNVGSFHHENLTVYMTLRTEVFDDFKRIANKHFNIEVL